MPVYQMGELRFLRCRQAMIREVSWHRFSLQRTSLRTALSRLSAGLEESLRSDDAGMISGQFPGSLGGARYVLLVTIHPAAFTVQDAISYFTPKEPRGAGMDLFDILLRVCPGAPPQRMSLGNGGRVCTQSDTVRLRVEPSRSANFERQLAPGSQFTVVDGPACADKWPW